MLLEDSHHGGSLVFVVEAVSVGGDGEVIGSRHELLQFELEPSIVPEVLHQSSLGGHLLVVLEVVQDLPLDGFVVIRGVHICPFQVVEGGF